MTTNIAVDAAKLLRYLILFDCVILESLSELERGGVGAMKPAAGVN